MANLDEIIFLNAIEVLQDVEDENLIERRIFQRINPFDMPDNQFIKIFRLSKAVTLQLIEMLEPYLIPPTRSSAIDSQTKVLTALRFFASGGYQTDTGFNQYTGISQASVSRCVAEASNALNNENVFQMWVKFPTSLEEVKDSRNGFYGKFQFPGLVGAIDCTHVAIIAPKDDEYVYVNRKGYHSINVQLVCDSNMKIIHACARYPGSTHDSYIWNKSSLKDFFENLHQRGQTNFFLLGYALRTSMMTTIINPEPARDTPEYRYNSRQMSTRAVIERCNGLLKMRFRCLLKHRVLHYSPAAACKIINACIVLHNICVVNNIPLADEIVPDLDLGFIPQNNENGQPIGRINPDLAKGRAFRQNLIDHF